jgi:hypothetical protein
MSYRGVFRLLVIVLVAFAAPIAAEAQVVITSPSAGQRLKAGPDYGTDVLANPMDMSDTDDISPDPLERPGWSALNFSGGRLTGTTASIGGTADSSIAFLYRGFYGLVNPGRNGMKFPIDPNAYRKLSFKMSSTAAGENVQVYWYHRPLGDPAGVGFGMRFAGGTTGGEQIFSIDLADATNSGEPWNAALVRGFRVDPNSAQTGQQISFDWVRLTAADGAPGAAMHTITWTGGSGSATIDVIDAAGTVMPIASGITATSYAWNYGVLPPGSYTLRIRRGTSAAVTQAFRINAPPIVRLLNPDDTGGADYATDVLRNPWDMAGAPDVIFTSNIGGASYSGGFFHGTSNTTGDPSVFLLNQSNNGTPIDSRKYRYLSFDLQVDGVYDLGRGSVARIFWGSQSTAFASNMTTTKDIIVFPGLNHYTIDLASLSTAATGGLEPTGAAQAWSAAPVTFLRIDPHEFPEARNFHVSGVKLGAVDEAAPFFTVQWFGADADGDAATVSLYYDTNTNPGDGMTLIAANVAMSGGAYQWNASAVPTGTYYLYAVANDGVQQYGRYSTAPINVHGGSSTGTSDVVMSIDSPANWASVRGPFTLAGWAIDRGAATGTGVDAIHVYAYPNPGSGQAPVFLGAASYGGARGDVGAAYGARFSNSGYGLSASLGAGNYQIVVFAHSTVTGTFARSASVMLSVQASTPAPRMSLDSPTHNTAVTQPFAVAGWAIDAGTGSGTGVDAIHVYAYPNPGSGAAPIFVGVAPYGAPRADIASTFGPGFRNSGFNLLVNNLAPGTYQMVAFAHSTVTGTFNNSASAVVRITKPIMSLDSPLANTVVRRGFAISGWALDLGAPSGTGVDAIHVWAYPTNGAPAIFVGVAGYGAPRADVGRIYGTRFSNSGFNLAAANLASGGVYDIVVYAHSTVTGTFNNWRVARVTVQ